MRLFRLVLLVALLPFLAGRAFGGDVTPSFNKDVAPILFQNCSTCHRPNEVGPFSLLTYADAQKRAKQIAEITEKRIMPPWKPVAAHDEFMDALADPALRRR